MSNLRSPFLLSHDQRVLLDIYVELYENLCEQLGQDADTEEFERMSYTEVRETIDELLKMQKKDVGTDDCYWY